MDNDDSPLLQLQEALISAYPTRSDLEQMVAYGLSENLAALAGNGNLQQTLFELLRWAEARGKLAELVRVALQYNPQNPQLRRVAQLPLWNHDQHSNRHLSTGETEQRSATSSLAWQKAAGQGHKSGQNQQSIPPVSTQGERASSRVRQEPVSAVSSFVDVCVVCALAQEAKAFLDVVEQDKQVSFTHGINTHYGYDYRLAVMTNEKGESLRVHVSWLSRYGPQEMTLHLSRVIEEYQPRLVAMTGICAGDQRLAHLGDLVVAERTFTYDSGKVVQDADGQAVHLHNAMTYQMPENVLRFVHLFVDWKTRVAAFARPISKRQQRDWLLQRLLNEPIASVRAIPISELEQQAPLWRQLVFELQQGAEPFLLPSLVLRDREMVEQLYYGRTPFPWSDPLAPRCHIRPMASGSAVRSDDPFREIQIPVRGTVAIDMEGAAFGRVMESFPGIAWLIVKAVSDYADRDKDDSYHDYAQSVSAAYAMCLIEHYVTQERIPLRQGKQEASTRGTDSHSEDYDVFLCYNPADQAEAAKLEQQLKARGIAVWLESWRPGKSIFEQEREQIAMIKSAVVLVGKHGIATLQQMLADACLRQFVERPGSVSLIPVFLADAPQEPLPIFLDQFGWVDFRKHEPDPMKRLIWGITGERPEW